MARLCPSEPGVSTTKMRLRPDFGGVSSASRRADLPWAGHDRLVVTQRDFRTPLGGGIHHLALAGLARARRIP
jgi:hypothetical protein